MHLELISSRTCPFVQRARIVLLHKGVEHDVSYVDPGAPPSWLENLSPLGTVPLLRVDGRAVLFDSAAICEYLDETHPPSLHPDDPLARATHRGWIVFASDLQRALGRLAMAEHETDFSRTCADLLAKLGHLEAALGAGPFFDGRAFTLVDASFAPFWLRLALLQETAPLHALAAFPRCNAWSRALLEQPSVTGSVDADFPSRFRAKVAASGGYGATRFAPDLMLDRAAS